MNKTFILIRHAKPLNVEDRIYGRTDINIGDIELSSNNIEHHLSVPYQWVTSSLIRAKKTAEAVKNYYNKKVEIEIDNRLNEQDYGEYEGLKLDLFRKGKEPDEQRSYWHFPHGFRPPQGESFEDLVKRCDEFINSKILDSQNSNYILFTHGGFIRAFLALVLNLSPSSVPIFDIAPLTYTLIKYENERWHIKNVGVQL